MKILSIFSFICFLAFASSTQAQDITGDWNGALKIQSLQLRLIFHIKNDSGTLTATMDSPDQNGYGMEVEQLTFDYPDISLEIPKLRLNYMGKVNADYTQIAGRLTQMGQSFPMNLQREKIARKMTIRPQEPSVPYPYYVDEVIYDNKAAGIQLAGTLTLPDENGTYPTVILISGSGPQNRDEEILGHKPFLVIADYLTKQGIGVLRFDDRGVGLSTGKHATATSADFASDVQAGIDYLKTRKGVDKSKIGLMGHSEGGLIAPMVAQQNSDVAFLVLLAALGLPASDILLKQIEEVGRIRGNSEDLIQEDLTLSAQAYQLIVQENDEAVLKQKLSQLFAEAYDNTTEEERQKAGKKEDFVAGQVQSLTSPWFRYFLKHQPQAVLNKVTCPVLALNGENDLQVAATENLAAISSALQQGGNQQITVQEMKGLNHLFQHSSTGNPSEYRTIDETFAPEALRLISNWILKQ